MKPSAQGQVEAAGGASIHYEVYGPASPAKVFLLNGGEATCGGVVAAGIMHAHCVRWAPMHCPFAWRRRRFVGSGVVHADANNALVGCMDHIQMVRCMPLGKRHAMHACDTVHIKTWQAWRHVPLCKALILTQ